MDEEDRQKGNNEHWTIPIKIYLIFCTFPIITPKIKHQALLPQVIIQHRIYVNKIPYRSVSPTNSMCYILKSGAWGGVGVKALRY